MARKRNIHDVENLDKLDNPIPKANVHGMVTSLSPIKKGRTCSYFDGTLADGTKKVRIVGFSTTQRTQMTSYMEKAQSIKLEDCEVKQARRGNNMEIMLKANTKLEQSPKKFNIEFHDDTPLQITLVSLPSTNVYQRVTVNVKVQCVADAVSVANKQKQDVTVADASVVASAVATVTLWEDTIGSLQPNTSYCLKNFVVREYSSVKYLSIGRSDSSIEEISDIGEVQVFQSSVDDQQKELSNARIVAVMQLDKYKVCLRCKARVEPCTPPLGRCSELECNMLQHYEVCSELLSAKLLFLHNSKMISLNVFGPMLQQMTRTDHVTEELLLKLPKFETILYNDTTNSVTFFRF